MKSAVIKMTNSEEDIVVGSRIVAVLVDTIIIVVILFLLAEIFGFSLVYRETRAIPGGSMVFFHGGWPLLAGIFLLPVVYFTFFEAFMKGQTPGKRLAKIRVVKITGEPIGIGESFVRNILRIIDQLPVLYLLGVLLMATSKKRQRLGDMAANTIVIRVPVK